MGQKNEIQEPKVRVRVSFIYTDPIRGELLMERFVRIDRIMPRTKEALRNFVSDIWHGDMIHVEFVG